MTTKIYETHPEHGNQTKTYNGDLKQIKTIYFKALFKIKIDVTKVKYTRGNTIGSIHSANNLI